MENKLLLLLCIILGCVILYLGCTENDCPECDKVIEYKSNDSIINSLTRERDSLSKLTDSIYIKIDSIFKSIDDIEIKVDTKSKKEALEWIKYYNSQQSH